MIIETKFDIGQSLYIVAAGYRPCRVAVIKQSGANLFYEVEYWTDTEIRTVSLCEDELVGEIPKDKGTGFR